MDPNYLEGSEVSTSAAEAIRKLPIIPPTDQDFAREAQRQQRETAWVNPKGVSMPGHAYDEVFSKANGDEATKRLILSQNEELKKLSLIGITPVTIINLLPFKLQINGVLHSRYNLVVPPAPDEPTKKGAIAYGMRVLDHAYFDCRDLGSDMQGVDNFQAIPWLPIQVAQDFDIEYNQIQKTGCVFFYQGNHVPESSPVLAHQLKVAQQSLFQWCEKRCQEADLEFANDESRKNITEIHRQAWRILRRDNVVTDADKPAWLHSITGGKRGTPDLCANCTKPREGAICANCGNVFNPLVAYRDLSMIEFGHVSFGKMTDEEYKEALKVKTQRDKRQDQMNKKAGS